MMTAGALSPCGRGTKPVWALAAALLLAVAGGRAVAGERLRVAVSVVPHGWLVEQIAGSEVEVLVLVEPGESPATYQPTDVQVSRLMRATIYFRTGVPFENGPWFGALESCSRLEVVDLREGIPLRPLQRSSGSVGGAGSRAGHEPALDPHIWLSPELLERQASTIAEHLSRVAPDRRVEFEANWRLLQTRLQDLDAEIRQRLAPYRDRAFFVFHPSWGYFADRYGLRQIAIEIEGKSPSDGEMTELQRAARRERATTVFVQPQISGRGAQAVAAAIDGRLEILDPLADEVIENLQRVARRLEESFR